MLNRYRSWVLGIGMSCGVVCSAPAGMVLIENADGYTLNRKQQLVQFDAMAFDEQGKIRAVGHARALRKQFPTASHIDLQGKTVLPGLIDAHGHIMGLGVSALQLALRSTEDLQQAQRAIADYAARFPQKQWILGGEWNQANWKLERFPSAQDIDAVVRDRPVWLSRVDGHAAWANSKAMQQAGISRETPDPTGGKIERDEYGNPTGIFIDSAMELIDKVLPTATEAENRQALDTALQIIRQSGLTSVHDAGVSAPADYLFREYAKAGRLTVRVYGMIGGVGEFFDSIAAQGPFSSDADRYTLRAVKLFADGALGSRGAALLAPYSDAPQVSGLLFKSQQEMNAMVRKAAQQHYQVNVHAIGDAGNRQILDAFAALPASLRTELRNRIEHAQVVSPEDIPRFRTLGIIPSMQPTHATSDMNMAESRVGPQRIRGAYAWRSFLQQGSRIACGSDFPVESSNPFWGIYAAVTRQDMQGQPRNGWYSGQVMTVKEAFRCFTLDAAYAAHQENILGSLETGKWADFIVIDRNIFRIPARQIYQTQVLETWVAGQRVYRTGTSTAGSAEVSGTR
ncbi:amidohydrolase [Undibacterium griseum]|uniref:Amidohydrolase n=1 Tax=Undibacterium griseum TaxID=2762295 RepID=A0ABR6YR44_9BURK|nr:amidohydrolase [Undibacterium griseum]MBC3886362.1 amidohydrolase [Undibacterium griseum]